MTRRPVFSGDSLDGVIDTGDNLRDRQAQLNGTFVVIDPVDLAPRLDGLSPGPILGLRGLLLHGGSFR